MSKKAEKQQVKRKAGSARDASVWAISDMRRVSATQMGRVFGISRQAFSTWKDLPRNEDGTFNLPDVVAWKLRRVQEEFELEVDDDVNSEGLERYRQARAEKAEIEVAQMKRDLVSRVDVETRWGRVLTHIVQAFDGLGKILAPRLARRDEKEIATEIRSEVHRVIENAREAMLNDNEI